MDEPQAAQDVSPVKRKMGRPARRHKGERQMRGDKKAAQERGGNLSLLAKAKVKGERKILVAAGYTVDGGKMTVEGSRKMLAVALVEAGCRPEMEIARMAMDLSLPVDIRLKANIAILNKLVPDLKSVELQGDAVTGLTVVLKQYAGVLEACASDVAKSVTPITIDADAT